MHPRLLWDDLGAALASVVARTTGAGAQAVLQLTTRDIPNHGNEPVEIVLETDGIPDSHVNALRRTYEAPRLVELAGIAVAGLALYYAGRHEIVDVALRGTAADYLVDEWNFRLEVAGRSRRSDLETVWQRKWQRLREEVRSGFFLCIVEFETLTGRLAFQA